MSEQNESDIMVQLERLGKLTGLIKGLIWGAGGIGAVIVAVAGWVYMTNAATADHEIRLDELEPKVRSIEVYNAAPRVAPEVIHAIDKRVQRVEDQNVAIMEALRKIDSKLP